MFSQVLRSLRPFASRLALSMPLSLTIVFALAFAGSLDAQTASSSASAYRAPADRLTQPIQESNRVALQGTLHPLANKANDLGAVGDGMKLDRIQVVLKRSDAQESALKQLIGEMHSPGSANYHKWLTSDDFGKQFGPSDADVAKLESWLGSHGFSITKLNPGRQTLEIAGTAGQFRDTFHTQIHSYQVKGVTGGLETHFANSSVPDIPAAVAPVFGGFASLNNFHLKSHANVLGKAQYNKTTHESTPAWTRGSASNYSLVLAPVDFAVQYDLNPLYNAGTNGKGQSIAIVNESNINIAQVNNYRALFSLPVNPPQVIIDGNDPGIDGINSPYGPNNASFEAYLDVEVSGAVAPNAQINLVIADSTALEDGLALAAQRAVYSNISPVLSLSFGNCEANLGQSGNQFWSSLWEQAAAQGITVTVSSGDSGSAACDDDNTQEFAVRGQAISGIASTPYNVAVGGTDFYYSGGSASFGTYWDLSNPSTSTPSVSLTKKIPEQPFNSSQFGTDIFPFSSSSGTSIFATGGGASTAGLASGNTSVPYPKPSWQTGTGVPNDSARDIPDVSLFGSQSTNGSYTPICAEDGDCEVGSVVQISGVAGTSVAAPEFAGIMALVNQKYGRQGQANYILYPLERQFPTAFNDVIAGTNTVPCATTTVTNSETGVSYTPKNCQTVSSPLSITDSVYGSTTEGEIGLPANSPAYNATAGYDLATGLGTIDANNLVTNWGSVTLGATTTTLTPSSTSFAHGTAVTISGTVTGSNPTGDVALVTTSPDPNNQGVANFALSGGAYSGSVNFLPGGTYEISGYYPGDGSNAASSSTPVSITVTPESSTTTMTIYSSLTNTGNPLPASGGSISYGQPTTISAQSAGTVSKGASNFPTGSVVFSDGSTPVNTAVVNVEGDAEFNAAFAPGTHSITAKYSGDGSYNGSTSSATSFTVNKNTPIISFYLPFQLQNGDAVNGQINYIAVSLENSSAVNGLPLAPTGTVTLSGAPAGTPTTANLVPAVDPGTGVPDGVAYFAVPANASGNYALKFTYTGDTNYAAATTSQSLNFESTAGDGLLTSTVAATATAMQTSPSTQIAVTATVTGQAGQPAPSGTLVFFTTSATVNSQGEINVLAQVSLPSSSADSVTVTVDFDSAKLFQGTNQILLEYFPDNSSSYNPSSATVTIANPLSDFSLVPATTIVSVPGTGASAGTQTDTVNLTSYNGFSGAVGLTCAGSGGVICSLSSNSVTLASGGTASTTLSVDTSAVTKAGTYNVVITGTDSTGHYVHTIGLQVVTPLIVVSPGFKLSGTAVTISAPGGSGTSTITATPLGGFTGTVALTCALTGPTGAVDIPTCSAASESITGTTAATTTLTFNTLSTTTAGTYTATVTGTSGALTATTAVGVTVTGTVTTPGTFSLSNSAAITIGTQGGTGSSTISVVPGATNPYAGSVALTCAVTASPTGASEIPTCSLSPASVTLAGTTLTSTLTINTTAQTTKLDMPLKGIFAAGGGVALAALFFFGAPISRRGRGSLRVVRMLRILSVALFFVLVAGAGIGCGGGTSTGGGGTTPTGGTTTGTYTVTVTGTPASGTAQTVAVTVTVN